MYLKSTLHYFYVHEHKTIFYGKACEEGMYGVNCSTPCGHCLDSDQCHHINGTCISGCDSGYQGIKCLKGDHLYTSICGNLATISTVAVLILLVVCGLYFLIFITECDGNYFGRNCENMCNATCKGCNITNGICDKDCQPGWSGLFCQDGIFCEMHFNFFFNGQSIFLFFCVQHTILLVDNYMS